MMYRIIQSERHAVYYLVDADTEEEALERFMDGDGDIETEKDELVDTTIIHVEVRG